MINKKVWRQSSRCGKNFIDKPETIKGLKARNEAEMSIIKSELFMPITQKILIVGIWVGYRYICYPKVFSYYVEYTESSIFKNIDEATTLLILSSRFWNIHHKKRIMLKFGFDTMLGSAVINSSETFTQSCIFIFTRPTYKINLFYNLIIDHFPAQKNQRYLPTYAV